MVPTKQEIKIAAVGTTLEFYRAGELVEEGRVAARKAIAEWRLKQLVK